ncbi:MAG: sialidase, partial [Bacteroidales bacterium]|nr:sialidase [Bacteroidales bacterium]
MKRLNYSLLLLLAIMSFAPMRAADTIRVKQTKIPVLIEREDNVLFYLHVEASESEMLNELKFKISDNTNLDEIESIKLYYSGTESVQREKEIYYAPVQYISSHSPGNTLKANSSYSIKVVEQRKPSTNLTFSPNYKLFPGINYFWVSLQMKPSASVLSKVDIELLSAKLDNKNAPLLFSTERAPHRMGVGVRHAGDDGVAAFRIPGLVTSNEGTLLSVYDVRYNSSVDLQEHIDVGLSRSTDKGKTWEKMIIPMTFG